RLAELPGRGTAITCGMRPRGPAAQNRARACRSVARPARPSVPALATRAAARWPPVEAECGRSAERADSRARSRLQSGAKAPWLRKQGSSLKISLWVCGIMNKSPHRAQTERRGGAGPVGGLLGGKGPTGRFVSFIRAALGSALPKGISRSSRASYHREGLL